MITIKNKDLKNPDRYTLGKKRRFALLKFIAKNFLSFLSGILIFVLLIFGLSNDRISPFMSIPITAFIIYSQINNFKKYCNKKYCVSSDDKFRSADKSSLYSDGLKSKLSNDIQSNERFFIAETGIHRLVQVIKGKSCFYIHYLTIKDDGIGFNEDSLITDFENIDSCKKHSPKDYRIDLKSVKYIKYSEESVENTVLENSGTIMLKPTPKSKLKSKYFYPATHISAEYINEFFSAIKDIHCHTANTQKSTEYRNAFKNLGKKRIFYIIMKNLYYISTIFAFFIPNYTVRTALSLTNILFPVIILVFFCLNSNEYSIKDHHSHDNDGDFSANPNIMNGIIVPLFVNLITALMINVLDFGKFFAISLIIAAIITIILIIFSSDKKVILTSIMISIALSLHSVSALNYYLDFKEPYIHESQIYSKHYSSGSRGTSSHYIEIKLKNGENKDIRISSDKYKNCNENDTVTVYEYKGFLDIPYVEIYFDK